jgi:hypothetical protein
MKMKLTGWFLALAFWLVQPGVFAQKRTSFGLKGGTMNSTFKTDDIRFNKRLSMFTGVFVNISPGKLLALQPELLLVQKGAARVRDDIQVRENYRINYLELPLLFKLQFPLGRLFYPHLYFGPYYAQKLNGTYTLTDLNDGTGTEANAAQIKSNDYGTVMGAGVDIHGETLFLTFDARYNRGMTNIYKGENGLQDIRNKGLMLSAGIGIHLH